MSACLCILRWNSNKLAPYCPHLFSSRLHVISHFPRVLNLRWFFNRIAIRVIYFFSFWSFSRARSRVDHLLCSLSFSPSTLSADEWNAQSETLSCRQVIKWSEIIMLKTETDEIQCLMWNWEPAGKSNGNLYVSNRFSTRLPVSTYHCSLIILIQR